MADEEYIDRRLEHMAEEAPVKARRKRRRRSGVNLRRQEAMAVRCFAFLHIEPVLAQGIDDVGLVRDEKSVFALFGHLCPHLA